jgi:hypothetical protein
MATFVLVIIDGIVGLTVKINPKKIEITNAICNLPCSISMP